MQGKKTHKHKLGIIIPVYKLRESYLRECVNSVLDQDNLDMEIVLVDDCSPDNCGDVCEELASNDCRIKVVHHEKNKGLPAARNTGLAAVDSEWVSFVDGDDWVDSQTFSIILERVGQLDKSPDFVMFPGCLSYKDNEIVDTSYKEQRWDNKEKIDALQIVAHSMPLKIYPNRAVAYDTAWAKVISYDFLIDNEIAFRDLPYREDGMYFQELTEYANYIEFISAGMYHYRMTEGSMVHSFRPNAPLEQKKYLDMLWEFGESHKKGKEYTKALFASALVSMQVCITCFYYHEKNQAKNRRQQCIKYFSEQPYCNVFEYVRFKELKRNFLIKAVLIYTRNYCLLNAMRERFEKQ